MAPGTSPRRPRGWWLVSPVAVATLVAALAVAAAAVPAGLTMRDDEAAAEPSDPSYYSSSDPPPGAGAPPDGLYYPPAPSPPEERYDQEVGVADAAEVAPSAAPGVPPPADTHSVTVDNGLGADYVVLFSPAGLYTSITAVAVAGSNQVTPPADGPLRVGVVRVVDNGLGNPYLVVFATTGMPLSVFQAPVNLGVPLPATDDGAVAVDPLVAGGAGGALPAETADADPTADKMTDGGAGGAPAAPAEGQPDATDVPAMYALPGGDGLPQPSPLAAADTATAAPRAAVATTTTAADGIAGLPVYDSCSADTCTFYGSRHRCKIGASQDTFPIECKLYAKALPCEWTCPANVRASEVLCASDGSRWASRCFLNRASCRNGYTVTANSEGESC